MESSHAVSSAAPLPVAGAPLHTPRVDDRSHRSVVACPASESADHRHRLRFQTRAYIGVLTVVTTATGLKLLYHTSAPDQDRLALAAAMSGFMATAWLFPLPFSYQTKLYLDTSVILAAVLLFEPGVALVVAACGTALAHAVRRMSAAELLLNTSQTALQATAGGLVFSATGLSQNLLRFDRGRELLAIGLAAVAMYLVNTCSIAGVIALETSVTPLRAWYESTLDTNRIELLTHLGQLAIGLTAAMTAEARPWSVALLVVPSAAIYASFARYVRLRRLAAERIH